MSTDLRQLAAGSSPYALINALFKASRPAALYGIDYVGTSGLTLSLYGGTLRIGSALTTVDNQDSLALTDSATNYVDVDLADLTTTSGIKINTSAHVAAYRPLYAITTSGGAITGVTEHPDRARWQNPRGAIVMGSDANKTLTQAEALCPLLYVTSSGSLTATRDIILPLRPMIWHVYNGTTGGQSIRFIGASGTGITVATTKRAIVACDDSTNISRYGADV